MKSPSGKPTVNLSTTRLAIASGSSDTLTARLSRSLRRGGGGGGGGPPPFRWGGGGAFR